MGVRWRPVAVGMLALIALQALTSANGPAAGVAGIGWATEGLRRLLSPEVAGVPNRTGSGLPAQKLNIDPKTGVPNQDPNLPPLRDPKGRVY